MSQACIYARFLCEQAGVKFVLGSPRGRLETLIAHQEGNQKIVTGIRTADGVEHVADLVVVACKSPLKVADKGFTLSQPVVGRH